MYMVVIGLIEMNISVLTYGHIGKSWTQRRQLQSFVVTQKQKSNANNLKSEFKNLDNIEIHI